MTITVSCPSCATSFPVDPAKVPPEGVRAQCSNCPEIFDVDPPGATPEAPPAPELPSDTIEASDTLDAAIVAPPVEEPAEAAEDFGAVDLGVEASDTAEPVAEVVEPDATPVPDAPPVPDPPPKTAEPVQAEEPAAAPSEAAAEPPAAPVEAAESPGAIRFGRRSAEDKAKSLARSLVSDLIAYNPEKHKEALAAGTLPEVFGEEIDKSLKEYQEQVEPEVLAQGTFFNDALNSILAEEQAIFTLDT